jgi:hypothetical protein
MATFDYNYNTSQEHLQRDAIVVMQRIDNLCIKHYGVCDSNSPQEVRQTKGIIYRTTPEAETVVCKNIGFTPEISSETSTEQVQEQLKDIFGTPETKMFKAYESSLLRIWFDHVGQHWYMSTNRKIDAFYSKWAKSESYGAIFTKLLREHNPDMTLEQYYSRLNKDFIYLFSVLSTRQNRIITTKENDECQFIGAFDITKDFSFSFDHPNVVFSHPEEVTGLATVDELCKHVNSVDPIRQQGVMVITSGLNPQCVKIVHPMYLRAFNIRNNTLTPLNRFIQLMSKKYSGSVDNTVVTETNDLIRELGDVYPELRGEFDNFKDVIASIAKNVRKAFIKRINGIKNVFIPKQQNQVLKELFSLYSSLESKDGFDLSLNAIFRIIYSLTENSVYHLYSSFNERKAQLGNGNWLSEDEIKELKTRFNNQRPQEARAR